MKNSSFFEGVKFAFGILFFLGLMSGIFVFGSGWHPADEILSGNFSTGDFNFNGSIGIGTTTPTSLLTLNSSVDGGSKIELHDGSSPGNRGGRIYSSWGANGLILDSLSTDGAGHVYLGSASSYTDYLHFYTNGTERMFINSSGNVGIGTTDPSQKLDVVGNIEATAFYYSSDITLKDNITPLTSQLDKVTQLQGVSFNWKENGREDIGVIAQDIEKIYPELVATDSKGIKSVQYGNLVAPLIEAIKEQQIQIEFQKKLIEEQNNKLQDLSQRIEALENN